MQSAFETKSDCDRRAEALNDLERAVAKIERSSGEAREYLNPSGQPRAGDSGSHWLPSG